MQMLLEDGDTQEGMIEAFKVFDRDMGGDITSTELRDCMMNLGDKMNESQVDEMIRMMDLHSGTPDLDKQVTKYEDNERSGEFNYAEFVEFMFSAEAMVDNKLKAEADACAKAAAEARSGAKDKKAS